MLKVSRAYHYRCCWIIKQCESKLNTGYYYFTHGAIPEVYMQKQGNRYCRSDKFPVTNIRLISSMKSLKKINTSPDPDAFGNLNKHGSFVNAKDIWDPEDKVFKPEIKRKRLLDYIHDMMNLSRGGRVKEALKVYDSLFEMGVRIHGQHVFTVAISICGKVGYTKKAFSIFRQLRDRGYNPSPATLTGLFNSCAESPFPKDGLFQARELRQKMTENGWHPSGITYHAMIKAFGKCGDIVTAFELVDEMRAREYIISTDTFAFVLMSCVANKEAGFGYAMLVLRKMEKFKIRPDIYTFNLMLRAAKECNVGPRDILTQLFTTKSINLNSYSTSNKLLDAESTVSNKVETEVMTSGELECHKSGDLTNLPRNEVALIGLKPIQTSYDRLALLGGTKGFLSEMRKLNCHPTLKTFTLLLECQEQSSVENETMLLDEMKISGVQPDIALANALMKKRCIAKRYTDARDVLQLIVQCNLIPDVTTFGTLAMSCRNESQARTFLTDMTKAGFRPNTKILGALVATAKFKNDYKMAAYLMKQCSLLAVIPDKRILDDLEELRSNGKKQLLQEEKGVGNDKFDQEGFTCFIKLYKTWLQNTKVDLPRHPWKQYKSEENV